MTEPGIPTFRERCKQECTRNVVFLFQTPRWIHTGFPYTTDGEYGHDGEGTILGDTVSGHWESRENAEYLTNEQLEEMETIDGIPCAIKTWETQFVTLSREEGESHGKEYDYRYRNGWRVYGVHSIGKMVDVIKVT